MLHVTQRTQMFYIKQLPHIVDTYSYPATYTLDCVVRVR